MLAVLNMLCKNCECFLPLSWANLNDRVNHTLSVEHIVIYLDTISQELQEHLRFVGKSVEEKSCRLDGFNLEVKTKIW